MQVRGSDLWVTGRVAPFLLDDGGRAAVETPLGVRTLWVSGRIAERRLIRWRPGLPARADYPQGSLFIRLIPTPAPPKAGPRQLKRFAAAWAA